MTPRISLVVAVAIAVLAACVPAALADPWGSDRLNESTFAGSPDAADRAIAAEQKRLGAMLDVRESAFGAKREVQLRDDRFVIDPPRQPAPESVTVSDRVSGWPQVGFGVLLGFMLALGLMLVIRTTRGRELAH